MITKPSASKTEIAMELSDFINAAKRLGLDLRGDALRFFSIRTARAWTVWFEWAELTQ